MVSTLNKYLKVVSLNRKANGTHISRIEERVWSLSLTGPTHVSANVHFFLKKKKFFLKKKKFFLKEFS